MVNLPKQFIALSNWNILNKFYLNCQGFQNLKIIKSFEFSLCHKNKFYYIRFEFMKEKRDNKTNPNSHDVIAVHKSNIIRKYTEYVEV